MKKQRKKEEEKVPIESYTIVIPEDEIRYDLVNNVKLRPDIEKKIKKMFAESITYLESADMCKEYLKIIKDLMKFDISDSNNCFEFVTTTLLSSSKNVSA